MSPAVTDCSWRTLTASVGWVPPATLVIWRSAPGLPTDTAAWVLTVAPDSASTTVPPARLATEPVPSATPPLCCTTAPKPIAVPREMLVAALSGVPPASALSPTATPPPPARAWAPIACEPVASAPVPIAIALVPVAWALLPIATELAPLATACGPTATALVPVADASGRLELVWK